LAAREPDYAKDVRGEDGLSIEAAAVSERKPSGSGTTQRASMQRASA
jgi:hypothetical protein